MEKLRYAGAHEYAAADIANDRIAAITRRRVGLFDDRDGLEHGVADPGGSDIAGQHTVAFTEHATLVDAPHDVADQIGAEHLPGPVFVARAVGELHGMDRPHLDANPLQREDSRRIADVTVSNMRLDRQQIHSGSL
jgi:hypothetical protein